MLASASRFASRTLSRLFGRGRAVILKYHRVLPSDDMMRVGETTAREFDLQMSVVASAFRCQTFGSFIRGRRDGAADENTVIVTFDDGYRDNHDVALPILEKHGIPATIFVASSYVDGGMMWNDRLIEAMRLSVGRTVDLAAADLGKIRVQTADDARRSAGQVLAAIKRWPQERRDEFVDGVASSLGYGPDNRIMMNAAEVLGLARAGMEIGAHTVTHPILSTLAADAAWSEISQSKTALGRIIGREVETFAYPNGRPDRDFTAADVERVKAAGYIGAVTTEWGCATPRSDDYRVPRQGIWGANRTKIWGRLLYNFRA